MLDIPSIILGFRPRILQVVDHTAFSDVPVERCFAGTSSRFSKLFLTISTHNTTGLKSASSYLVLCALIGS